MPESVIEFREGEACLFGIIHSPPPHCAANDVMIVFLHGWAGYRIGPHQMFVKFARRLSHQGYHCLRFDFRGRGFSSGQREDTSYPSMSADLHRVLEAVQKQYPRQSIVLLGICSGAKLGLHFAKNGIVKIAHLIALSSPPLSSEVKVKLEARRTAEIMREYWKKLFAYNTWVKISTGNINTRSILRIVATSVGGLQASVHRSLKSYFRKRTGQDRGTGRKTIANAPEPFAGFAGEVLLIHGECDPETGTAVTQITGLLQHYNVGHQHAIIKGANHSFYALAWENEVYARIEHWLKEKYPARQPPLILSTLANPLEH